MSKEKLASLIKEQKEWIRACGGDLEGYIARYGSSDQRVSAAARTYYGAGGERIFEADTEALEKYQREWTRRFGTRTPLPEDKSEVEPLNSALNILQRRLVEVGAIRDKIRDDMDDIEELFASVDDAYDSLEDACESVKRMIETVGDSLSRVV